MRAKALALYKPPFRYEHGYIWDANDEMVADRVRVPEEPDGSAVGNCLGVLRIRGWGRLQYLENGGELQDEVGKLVAEALTKFWREELT